MVKSFCYVATALFFVKSIAHGMFIIGGERVSQFDAYPEVLRITNGEASCTGTLVGPRALLTAAHCLNESKKFFSIEGIRFGDTFGECEPSPKYESEGHDIAFCRLTSKPKHVRWASVLKVGEGPQVYDVVTHAGYGCTKEGGFDSSNGFLKAGNAQVLLLRSPQNHHWVTQGAGLCFGDSGGPTFIRLREPKEEHHYVLGVNSKGNIKDTNYIADMTSSDSHEFMESWSEKHNLEICGYNKVCDL